MQIVTDLNDVISKLIQPGLISPAERILVVCKTQVALLRLAPLNKKHLKNFLMKHRPVAEVTGFAEEFAVVGGDYDVGVGRADVGDFGE